MDVVWAAPLFKPGAVKAYQVPLLPDHHLLDHAARLRAQRVQVGGADGYVRGHTRLRSVARVSGRPDVPRTLQAHHVPALAPEIGRLLDE